MPLNLYRRQRYAANRRVCPLREGGWKAFDSRRFAGKGRQKIATLAGVGVLRWQEDAIPNEQGGGRVRARGGDVPPAPVSADSQRPRDAPEPGGLRGSAWPSPP